MFNATCVSNTIYSTSWTSKLKKNYYLYDFFASFASFWERGFDNYLQHFEVMDVGSWHLSLCFFTCADAAFSEGPPLLVFSVSTQFLTKIDDILMAEPSRARPGQAEPSIGYYGSDVDQGS